jgi:hypothetical protein
MSSTDGRELMMSTETCNGWANYETWGVALILDNDEGTYNECSETAERLRSEAAEHHNVPDIWTAEQAARFELADWLKDFTETLCGIGAESEDFGIAEPTLMARQLLGAALSDVDWDEIAGHYLETDS